MTTEMTPNNMLMDNISSPPHGAALTADQAQDDQKTPLDLDELTGRIRDEYQAAMQCAKGAVSHAVSVGRLLQLAKRSLAHGDFACWIAENFEFSARRAQQYMRLAGNSAVLAETNANRDSHLSIRQALRVIADQQPLPTKKKSCASATAQGIDNEATTPQVVEQTFPPQERLERRANTDRSCLSVRNDGLMATVADKATPSSPAIGHEAAMVDPGDAVSSANGQPEMTGESFICIYGEVYQMLCSFRSADWTEIDRQVVADCLQVLWNLLDMPEGLVSRHADGPELKNIEARMRTSRGKKSTSLPLPKRRRSGLSDPTCKQYTSPDRMPEDFSRPWYSLMCAVGQARKTNWTTLNQDDARHYVNNVLGYINL